MKKILLFILFLSYFYSIVFGAASDYAGVYSGNIAGNDSGPWMGVVESTGRTKMVFYSNIYQTMDGSQGYYVDSSGNLTAVSLVNRAVFSVSFDTGGNILGTWASPNSASGTISGSRQTNNSKYAGTYTGTISGGDSGSWTIVIDSSGLISGSGSSQNVGSFNFDGAVDNTGFLMGVTEEAGAFGSISGNSLSGSWFDDGVSYGGTFNGTKQSEDVNGYLVTNVLWLRAVIQTEDVGAIEGIWKSGGSETTSYGTFLWGYFYADPSDVSWGSADNPEIFVKVAIIGDWVNVNYFHVSVPDIDVYTDYPYDGTVDASNTATGPPPDHTSYRFVEHTFENGTLTNKTVQYEDGQAPTGYSPSGSPTGYEIMSGLKMGAMINSISETDFTSVVPIEGIWVKGGEVTNSYGTTVWGYFHASSSDVRWGSSQNPDLFVKVLTGGTWAIVNYFHVSAPDIETFCDFPTDGVFENKATAILSNRFIEFRYSMDVE